MGSAEGLASVNSALGSSFGGWGWWGAPGQWAEQMEVWETVLPLLMNPWGLPWLLESPVTAFPSPVVKQSLTRWLFLTPPVIWGSDLANPQPRKVWGGGDSPGCSHQRRLGELTRRRTLPPAASASSLQPGPLTASQRQPCPPPGWWRQARDGKQPCFPLALASGSSWP